MKGAVQRSRETQSHSPVVDGAQSISRKLSIAVVFTNTQDTLAALRRAAEMAAGLGVEVRVVVPHIIPYPLPLEKPTSNVVCQVDGLRRILLGGTVPGRIEVCLCRSSLEGAAQALSPRSTVVIGGRPRWWPTSAQRLARHLRKAGHEVLFVEPNRGDHDFRHRLLSGGSAVLCRVLGLH